MPHKPKTPCRHPGCPNLVPAGTAYCDEHRSLHPEYVRGASSRGYGSAWQRVRRRFLQAHPLCEECLKQGRYTKATDVDHIVAHRGDADLFYVKLGPYLGNEYKKENLPSGLATVNQRWEKRVSV